MLITSKNREISDVSLRQTIAMTTRTVRNAFWDLAYAIASLGVQRQSLDLASESLRDTRARVEIGTTPPIDIVEAEAEVARRQEAVIVAEGKIGDAEDALRTLVFDPNSPDFWTIKIEPSDLPPFAPTTVNVGRRSEERAEPTDGPRTIAQVDRGRRHQHPVLSQSNAARRQRRSELRPVRGWAGHSSCAGKARSDRAPAMSLAAHNGASANVLGDLFQNQYPNWTAQLNISYPIGTSSADANLARVQLEKTQAQTRIRDQELQITTQVRVAAREVQTNQQRVESSRSARQLAERRLEAEQRKFEAGTSTSFLVFQAQRDLSQARNVELQNVTEFPPLGRQPGDGARGAIAGWRLAKRGRAITSARAACHGHHHHARRSRTYR